MNKWPSSCRSAEPILDQLGARFPTATRAEVKHALDQEDGHEGKAAKALALRHAEEGQATMSWAEACLCTCLDACLCACLYTLLGTPMRMPSGTVASYIATLPACYAAVCGHAATGVKPLHTSTTQPHFHLTPDTYPCEGGLKLDMAAGIKQTRG